MREMSMLPFARAPTRSNAPVGTTSRASPSRVKKPFRMATVCGSVEISRAEAAFCPYRSRNTAAIPAAGRQ
jgi:hypothetical protein